MDNSAIFWWLSSAGLVLLELLTGSFYLLMLALGAVLGAFSAHAGVSPTAQILVAAGSSSAFVFVCYLLRRRLVRRSKAAANRDLHLDIGAAVNVTRWDNGSAKVHHRGAQWTVLPCHGQTTEPGMYRVVEVVGSRLIVEKI